MQRGWAIAAALVCGAACGDDATSAGDTDGATSTGADATTRGESASSSGSATASSSSGAPTSSSSGADSSSGGEASSGSASDTGSSGSDEDSSSSTGEPLSMIDAEVTLYPQQPMVVDVTVTGDAALPDDLQLTHDFDDGVRVAVWASPDPQTRVFRARGLAPATKHGVTAATGDLSAPVAFTTEGPLVGFIPSFTTLGESSDEGPYRMFDLIPFPAFATSSLFMVDATGRTRFHYGQLVTALPGPDSVLAAAKLRDDGTLLFVSDNAIVILDELGEEQLHLDATDIGLVGLHHDVLELDDGNFLAIAYSFQTIDYPGVGPTLTAGDVIAEFTPTGELLWTWDSFDDLDPMYIRVAVDGTSTVPHPDTGEDAYDWTHANGIVVSPDGESVLISFRHQDWLVSIDRATATMEWRLGDNGDFDLLNGAWFFHQHSPQWQADGSLMLYDNGVGPYGPQISRVVRYTLDEETMEATQVFEDDDQTFASVFAGDADVLPETGNILVTDSAVFTKEGVVPRLREIDPDAEPMTIWELNVDPGYFIYRATANDRLVGEAE